MGGLKDRIFCTWLRESWVICSEMEPLLNDIVMHRVSLWCSLSVFPVFSFSPSLGSHTVTFPWRSSSSTVASQKYPPDDKVWIYPTSTVALTQIYITYNLTYIRRVLHPEVLTEMQNVIMSLIICAVFHIYITQDAGCLQEEGREGAEMG